MNIDSNYHYYYYYHIVIVNGATRYRDFGGTVAVYFQVLAPDKAPTLSGEFMAGSTIPFQDDCRIPFAARVRNSAFALSPPTSFALAD
jgi:hypothetical protein